MKSCVICELNRAPYNQKTSGTSQEESLLCRPGEIIYVDSIHLNRSSTGNKYCVISVDRLTSFITAVPVTNLKVENIIAALRTFLSTMTFPRIVKSDLGPEYSMGFTQELSRYVISHEGQIPNTSNQQGSVEQAIRLLRGMLCKIVSLDQYGGRENWEICLPIVLKNINESSAYQSPFLLQKNSLDRVNLKRIENLMNKKVSKKITQYKIGNFVLLAGLPKTTKGSKSNVTPR